MCDTCWKKDICDLSGQVENCPFWCAERRENHSVKARGAGMNKIEVICHDDRRVHQRPSADCIYQAYGNVPERIVIW